MLISGAQPAAITPAVLTASDPDSPEEALRFVVAQTPMWGFLEHVKTTTRSGRSQTSRRVSAFTLSDLREGVVRYVPSNLSRGRPPSDSFSVYVTDGRNRSPLAHIDVAVQPPSASLPEFSVANVVVTEGGRKELEVRVSGEGEESWEDAERLVESLIHTISYFDIDDLAPKLLESHRGIAVWLTDSQRFLACRTYVTVELMVPVSSVVRLSVTDVL